ncbi:MAG TPA: lipopolysaccharide assembly protein LapA domain-containing protein [Xanthobacteraceae bacterium]|nr:lipopolysaccharide assembly protein LapA domain-containing protein [Xanthobacteraceae bacterium]
MLRRLLLIVIVLPVSLVLVALAVANRQPVQVALDPFSADSGLAVAVPLYVLVFGALILGVVLGGVAVWLRQGRFRRSARVAAREARAANAQAEELRARLSPGTPAARPSALAPPAAGSYGSRSAA